METWFDDYGYLIKDIPEEVAVDCSHQGECHEDVKFWQEKLDFMAPRQMMIDYLREYGAWTIEELSEKDDTDLAQIVLWLACGDIKENGEWFGLVH